MSFLSKLLMLFQITANRITNIISHDLLPMPMPIPMLLSEPAESKMSVSELDMVMNKLGLPACEELQPIDGWVRAEELSGLFEDDGPSLEELKETFDVFDENKDGFIDARELRRVLKRLGLEEEEEEEESSGDLRCERMIRGFDENGDGLVDFREFVKLMEKCFL